ncbi:MAG: acyl-CoA dehydrogenase [Blastochloris viridis]|uniref:Acyl-coenzyme A dehydrogenase n=1 Tax=Blastochloris viridis TaxID=1079 RepID=A0A6N4RDC6_BLAVI|nr:MAG: acyl-CoA dehydrogenase [Blastochloris viridis]
MELLALTAGTALAGVLAIKQLRIPLLSAPAMRIAKGVLPSIGDTERIALEAGTVWWDGEIFSGKPKWKRLLSFDVQALSKEEKAFLAGPVEELCALIDDHQIFQDRDLSPQVWKYIKDKKFFGMIIPKEHGGLGFSATMHSAVVTKIASRSLAAAVTVMVPNSLGPGELLLRYGTDAQKKHYLPRLAKGLDIPCFALTEPHAGSDAASGSSFGVVVKKKVGGKDVLGMELTFNKRYITLAPVATVVGLAFRLTDPDHLLGDKVDLGITCALLPRDTKGLEIGEQHDPMGVPFKNGPVRGKKVFVPLDVIIGGPAQAGEGWKMLMEALAAGRGISLPSLSVGAAELSLRAAGAYAGVREQFGLPVGKFEGVRERIARMAMNAHLMNAVRLVTCGAIDAGEHPAVASGISKAYLTEGMRVSINDAMDVIAGAAICRGPRNMFARAYNGIPIGITVEGSNILTRSLIVFGQGAMRSHPYLQDEVNAIGKGDVKAFDKAFFGHIRHFLGNAVRAFVLNLTRGHGTFTAHRSVAKHYRHLNRLAASFALLTDFGLLILGGSLKRKEYLSGRYADALAGLYMASTLLKQVHDKGYPASTRAITDMALQQTIYDTEQALLGVVRNLPNKPLALLARLLALPLGARLNTPKDKLIDKVAEAVLQPAGGVREALCADIFIPDAKEEGLGKLEATLLKVTAAEPVRRKITAAIKERKIKKGTPAAMTDAALMANVITAKEHKLVLDALAAQDDVVQVDYYSPAAYSKLR